MDRSLQQGSERIVNHAMACRPGLIFEGVRDERDGEMAFAMTAMPGMPPMPIAIVRDRQKDGRKGGFQPFAHGCGDGAFDGCNHVAILEYFRPRQHT